MKEEPTFDKTPEFRRFKEVMRGVLAVPKKRLDELILSEKKKSTKRRGTEIAKSSTEPNTQ